MLAKSLVAAFLAAILFAPIGASAVTYLVSGEISAVSNRWVGDQTVGEELIGRPFRFELQVSEERDPRTSLIGYEAFSRKVYVDGVEQPAKPTQPQASIFVMEPQRPFLGPINIIDYDLTELIDDGNPSIDGNVLRAIWGFQIGHFHADPGTVDGASGRPRPHGPLCKTESPRNVTNAPIGDPLERACLHLRPTLNARSSQVWGRKVRSMTITMQSHQPAEVVNSPLFADRQLRGVGRGSPR